MRKLWWWALMLAPLSGLAQTLDVTGDQLLQGSADGQLQAIAGEAARTGQGLQVSAPEYWHDLIAGQLQRGAAGLPIPISYRDTTVEMVTVRVVPAAAQVAVETAPEPVVAPAPPPPTPTPAPAAAPAPAPAPPPRPAPPPAAAPVAAPASAAVPAPPPQPQPQPVAPTTPAPAPTPAAAPSPAPVTAATPPPAPAPAPVPVPVVETEVPAPAPAVIEARVMELAELPVNAQSRLRLERIFNGRQRLTAKLRPEHLLPGDQLYVYDDAIVVVRSQKAYWLIGQIDLNGEPLQPEGGRKYVVKAKEEGQS